MEQSKNIVPIHQWRRLGTAPWWDGFPDQTDGGGPYETRTLYAHREEPVKSKNNGGPAFPEVLHWDGREWGSVGRGGMTLRDYFAAKALAGMVARPGGINTRQDAEFAYILADAMLKARES